MANTTGGDKVFVTPWTTDTSLRLPAAIPAASTTFYAGQAMMRDASGNLIQCDDTVKGEFVGIQMDIVRTTVDPTDQVQVNGLIGDKMFDVVQCQLFTALIAAAAAGDEGKKVYWLYNNQVSYSPGTNGNYAGTVWLVKDSTHVVVRPPWTETPTSGGKRSVMTLGAAAASVTLTKFDVNRTFLSPATVAQTVNLPDATKCSPGDQMSFVYTGAGGVQVTLDGSGAQTINGAATYALGLVQYSAVTIETDGANWYVV